MCSLTLIKLTSIGVNKQQTALSHHFPVSVVQIKKGSGRLLEVRTFFILFLIFESSVLIIILDFDHHCRPKTGKVLSGSMKDTGKKKGYLVFSGV